MNRLIAPAVTGAAAFILLAGAAAGGYVLHNPKTVTAVVTKTAPPKVITKTVRVPGPAVTVTATPGDDGVTCWYGPDLVDLTGDGAPPGTEGTCTVTPDLPLSSGEVTITAPNGVSATYAAQGT